MSAIPPALRPFGQDVTNLMATLGAHPSFDRDAGYTKIGDRVLVPAGAGMTVGIPEISLQNVSMADRIMRWGIVLGAEIPDGTVIPANTALGLQFAIRATSANELIPKTIYTEAGIGEVGPARLLYARGRTLSVVAMNPTAVDLYAHYGLDNAVAGFSTWQTFEEITTDATEVTLYPPPYTISMDVLTQQVNPAAHIRGYNNAGVLAFDQTLTVPNSGTIPLFPGLLYTLSCSVNAATLYHINYNMFG